MQSMQLLHCEGYTAYKYGVLEAVAEASKAAGATFSLDMASFEVVRNCWSSLQPIIESGRIEVLFCNEDEASEIVRQYGAQLPPVLPFSTGDVCVDEGRSGTGSLLCSLGRQLHLATGHLNAQLSSV